MTYQDLLQAAVHDPGSVDFTELRLAYARSPEYDPYRWGKVPWASSDGVCLALQAGDTAGLLVALCDHLEQEFLDISAHQLAELAYQRIGHRFTAAFHRSVARGCLDSILQSGDGQSFQTAYQVISVAEEYALLETLDITPGAQSLIEHQGHHYDVFDYAHRQTGEQADIYFNVDLPIGVLEKYERLGEFAQLRDRPGSRPMTWTRLARGPAAKVRLFEGILLLVILVSLLLFLGGVLVMETAKVEGLPFPGRTGGLILLASGIGIIVGATLLILITRFRRP